MPARITLLATVLLPASLSLPASDVAAQAGAPTVQEATATPEAAAELFLRSLRALRWDAAARFVHPHTLDRFRFSVDAITEADSTGGVRRLLTATPTRREYADLDDAQVFARSLGVMIDSLPGLRHAVFDREDRVVGSVSESADSAHVVYRTTPRLSGAVSEVAVMQLTRTETGWRVVWSDELEVLDTALRGFARPVRPPPPPPPAGERHR